MGKKGDQVYIEKKGNNEMALYYLVNQHTLHTIDMFFDSIEAAIEYVNTRGLNLIENVTI